MIAWVCEQVLVEQLINKNEHVVCSKKKGASIRTFVSFIVQVAMKFFVLFTFVLGCQPPRGENQRGANVARQLLADPVELHDENLQTAKFYEKHKIKMDEEVTLAVMHAFKAIVGRKMVLFALDRTFLSRLRDESAQLGSVLENLIKKYYNVEDLQPKCFDYDVSVCQVASLAGGASVSSCPREICPATCEVCIIN